MKKSWVSSFWSKIEEYKRIISISRKPTLKEIKNAAKVSLIGIVIVGVLGFLIQLIFAILGRFLG